MRNSPEWTRPTYPVPLAPPLRLTVQKTGRPSVSMPFCILPGCGEAPSDGETGPGRPRIEGRRNTRARFLLD